VRGQQTLVLSVTVQVLIWSYLQIILMQIEYFYILINFLIYATALSNNSTDTTSNQLRNISILNTRNEIEAPLSTTVLELSTAHVTEKQSSSPQCNNNDGN
jgi:hypothetical protein